jgi:hypothetical protein
VTGFRFLVVSAILHSVNCQAGIWYYTINSGDNRISQWNQDGAFFGNSAALSGVSFNSNSDIEFDGTYYYGLKYDDPIIRRYDAQGNYLNDVATLRRNVGGSLIEPMTLQAGFAMDGNFYYTIAPDDQRIRKYDLSGIFLSDVGNLQGSGGSAITSETGLSFFGGYFYSIAKDDNRVRKYNSSGVYIQDEVILTNPNASGQNALFLGTGLSVSNVPEPSSLSLLLAGGTLLLGFRNRFK